LTAFATSGPPAHSPLPERDGSPHIFLQRAIFSRIWSARPPLVSPVGAGSCAIPLRAPCGPAVASPIWGMAAPGSRGTLGKLSCATRYTAWWCRDGDFPPTALAQPQVRRLRRRKLPKVPAWRARPRPVPDEGPGIQGFATGRLPEAVPALELER
jgi:hypothetical protein